jgi:hypothetical protein
MYLVVNTFHEKLYCNGRLVHIIMTYYRHREFRDYLKLSIKYVGPVYYRYQNNSVVYYTKYNKTTRDFTREVDYIRHDNTILLIAKLKNSITFTIESNGCVIDELTIARENTVLYTTKTALLCITTSETSDVNYLLINVNSYSIKCGVLDKKLCMMYQHVQLTGLPVWNLVNQLI